MKTKLFLLAAAVSFAAHASAHEKISAQDFANSILHKGVGLYHQGYTAHSDSSTPSQGGNERFFGVVVVKDDQGVCYLQVIMKNYASESPVRCDSFEKMVDTLDQPKKG